jgi:DNA-binding GntR family transcriptional regulator
LRKCAVPDRDRAGERSRRERAPCSSIKSAKEGILGANKADAQVAQLISRIEADIIFGRLRPRERLVEEEICERFSVSRYVLREALKELEPMGLIVRRPNRGAVVRDFSLRQADQIYDVRTILQAEAARRIPVLDDSDLIGSLEKIHVEYCRAHEVSDLDSIYYLNVQFHRRIWEACDNDYLVSMINKLWIETIAVRSSGLGDRSLLTRAKADHGDMIEAMRRNDRDRFVALCVDHIRPSLEAFKRSNVGWRVAS